MMIWNRLIDHIIWSGAVDKPPQYLTRPLMIGLLTILLCFIVFSCSRNYFYAVPSTGMSIENGYLILQTDSLTIAVKPEYPHPPVASSFNAPFSLRIDVKNRKSYPIQFLSSDVYIIASEEQFDPIPFEWILGMLRENELLENYVDPFSFPVEKSITPQRDDDIYTIINDYFGFGVIAPNTRKSGIIYFSGEINNARSFELMLANKPVLFEKE